MNQKLIELAKVFDNRWNPPASQAEKNIKTSIIVPVYYPEHLDGVLKHLSEIEKFHEIILVDDSGNFNNNEYNPYISSENIRVIYHKKNIGRPAARNSGVAYASGDILLFLDQDMFLNPSFLIEMRKYYETNKSLIFLGLRDTVPYKDIPKLNQWVDPDLEKDWRIKTSMSSEFVDLTVQSIGGLNHNCKKDEALKINNETDNLRKMGIKEDNTIGFWDLPSMVVSHTLAISSLDYYRIGGFPEWIQGWGGEDIILGFLACAAHIPICLSRFASYQAAHNPYSGSEKAKICELMHNLEYYREWALEAETFPCLNWQKIKNRVIEYII